MNGRETLRIIAAHGAIVVVVLVCATILTALHFMPVAITESFFGAALAWAGAVSSGVIRRQVPKVESPVRAQRGTGLGDTGLAGMPPPAAPAEPPAIAVRATVEASSEPEPEQ